MLTLAFAQLLYAVAFKWTSITGASDGLAGIPRNPGPFSMMFLTSKTGFYYLVAGCLLAAFVACRSLVRSPFGAVLRGIRENEAKTLSLGYNTRRYKIAVVAIAFAFGGLAGALVHTVCRIHQYGTAVLAALGPSPDHGDRGRFRHAGRADHRRGVLHVGVKSAELVDRFLGVVLWTDFHRLRVVRAAGNSGDWRRAGLTAARPRREEGDGAP